jgi:putative salt-induced outer membrane protein YdiY
MNIRVITATAMLLLLTAPAAAQEPKFEYGKVDEVKDVKAVEWKASAQAGLIYTTGNSRVTTFAGGANASRKAGNDKFSAEAGAAYARSNIIIGSDLDASGGLSRGEIQEVEVTTTRQWLLKTRYDRFLTEKNSLYLTARVMADKPAGKQLVGGAQAGYSRLLFKDDRHELASEVGYDFSYENYVAPGDPVNIHSARVFAGYVGKLRTDTELSASTEALFNLNSETTPTGDVNMPTGEIDSFKDTRINSKAGLTTKLTEHISFRFGFNLKYDQAPAPRPQIGGLPYEFPALARKFDTITEAQLIINLL